VRVLACVGLLVLALACGDINDELREAFRIARSFGLA